MFCYILKFFSLFRATDIGMLKVRGGRLSSTQTERVLKHLQVSLKVVIRHKRWNLLLQASNLPAPEDKQGVRRTASSLSTHPSLHHCIILSYDVLNVIFPSFKCLGILTLYPTLFIKLLRNYYALLSFLSHSFFHTTPSLLSTHIGPKTNIGPKHETFVKRSMIWDRKRCRESPLNPSFPEKALMR